MLCWEMGPTHMSSSRLRFLFFAFVFVQVFQQSLLLDIVCWTINLFRDIFISMVYFCKRLRLFRKCISEREPNTAPCSTSASVLNLSH